MAQVLSEVLNKSHTPRVTAFFLALLHSIEGQQGLATRFLSVQAARNEMICLFAQVVANLFIKFLFHVLASKQRSKSQPQHMGSYSYVATALRLRQFDNMRDGRREPVPVGRFFLQFLTAQPSERIVFGAP